MAALQIVRRPGVTLPPAPPDDVPVGSPLWWLYTLHRRLGAEQYDLERFERYNRGDHDLPYVRDSEVADQYRRLLDQARSNFMGMVVRVEAERLRVQGIRLKDDVDPQPDQDTWAIWQANDLDVWSEVAFETSLTKRRAYWSVWWDDTAADDSTPAIRVEDPTQVYVHCDPGNRLLRRAAIKVWQDEWTGEKFANVYLPDAIYRYRWASVRRAAPAWIERADLELNPLEVVPIIPMVNRVALLYPDGKSEIEDLIPIQDRVNTTLLNRQVAEHLAAFKQKWATGLEIPEDPETKKPLPPFKASVDSMFVNEDPTGKFGQFEATDLDNYGHALEQDIQHIAVISSTPRHYFTVQGQAPSGDAIKSAEAGLVAKVTSTQRRFGPAIIEALRLARTITGNTTPIDAELVWADPEFRTLGEQVDAEIKLLAAGVINENTVLEDIGRSPAAIKRIERERLKKQLLADANTPSPDTAGITPGTPPAA